MPQARKLIAAADRAIAIGRPLNRHITVHWEAAGIGDAEAMAATTAFLKYFREWLRGQTAYLWTRENGGGKGSHVHILAHLPAGRRWHGSIARRWITALSGNPYRAGVIHTRALAGYSDPTSEHFAANLQAVLAYAVKGVDPVTAGQLGIAHEFGGCVVGKRCGTSRNLHDR